MRCSNRAGVDRSAQALDSSSSIDSSMMFNWNDLDQAESTSWPDLSESEDRIVPHHMETEVRALLPTGDNNNCKRDEGLSTDIKCTEQSSRTTSDHLSCKSEDSSSFHTNEDFSSSRIDMDSLFDFPNICIDLKDEFTDGNDYNAMTKLMNDITDATSLNSMGGCSINLGHEPNLFLHEDKENTDFLDCDWATFGDFDDIENLFRKNGSILGFDMIGDADGFLSPSKDVIDSTAQSIPMPDLPSCKDPMSDEGCSSFQIDDYTDKQRSPLQKEKVDGYKTKPKSPNKAEETRKNKPSRNLKDSCDQHRRTPNANTHSSVTTPLQTIQSKAISQQMQYGDAKLMGQHGSSNQVAFVQHEYPALYLPSMHLPSHIQTDRKPKRSVPASYEARSDGTKHLKTSNRLPDAKSAIMTPHEKMEKLRRLQKMQAQHAIAQQQQHYSYQSTDANVAASQPFSQNNQALDAVASTITIDECAHTVLPSELKMEAEKGESKGLSGVAYNKPPDESIHHQLQDVVGKLDMRIRLCIRDSLFRLARSAIDRQCAGDRSSTDTRNKEDDEVSTERGSRNQDRCMILGGVETDTNPIDRIVANLLFHRPAEACPALSSSEIISS